ncbi:MAG: CBS domain-containing protein [Promethearchaeota archaeon]
MDLLSIKARDILVEDVITAEETDRIREVESRMFKLGIGGLPIVREKKNGMKIVGMLTHRDILIARHTLSIGGMSVKDLMSHDVISVEEDTNILDILRILKEKDIERLPVVDEGGYLIGLIMHKNILLAILDVLESTTRS